MSRATNRVVYIHRKQDTGEIFYVGMGDREKRPYNITHGRSEWWQRVVQKHGRTVEIVAKGLTREEAVALEMELIAHYGRIDLDEGGILVNRTLGGDGTVGRVWTDAEREAFAAMRQGMTFSQSHKDAIKATGNYLKAIEAAKSANRKEVVDTQTGDLYFSVKEAAEVLGLSYQPLIRMLNGKTKNTTTLQYSGKGGDFSNKTWSAERRQLLSDKKKGQRPSANTVKAVKAANSKAVIDTATGTEYASITDAAAAIGVSKVKLGRWLNGTFTNKSTMRFKEDDA